MNQVTSQSLAATFDDAHALLQVSSELIEFARDSGSAPIKAAHPLGLVLNCDLLALEQIQAGVVKQANQRIHDRAADLLREFFLQLGRAMHLADEPSLRATVCAWPGARDWCEISAPSVVAWIVCFATKTGGVIRHEAGIEGLGLSAEGIADDQVRQLVSSWGGIRKALSSLAVPNFPLIEVELLKERIKAEDIAAPTASQVDSGGKGKAARARMTVDEANERAKTLAKKGKKAFFFLSVRKQAEKIGCAFETWTETPFYQEAVKQGWIAKKKPKGHDCPPRAVSLTPELEAVTAEAEPKELVNQLVDEIAAGKPKATWDDLPPEERRNLLSEHETDKANDPSPLDPRRRKSRTRKKV